MCSLRDAAEGFEVMGVDVYGVSLDDVQDMKAFAEAQKLNFKLLSDPDGGVARKYGVLAKGARWAGRVTFLIDDEGVLRHVDDGVQVKSHGEDLLLKVEELMFE